MQNYDVCNLLKPGLFKSIKKSLNLNSQNHGKSKHIETQIVGALKNPETVARQRKSFVIYAIQRPRFMPGRKYKNFWSISTHTFSIIALPYSSF